MGCIGVRHQWGWQHSADQETNEDKNLPPDPLRHYNQKRQRTYGGGENATTAVGRSRWWSVSQGPTVTASTNAHDGAHEAKADSTSFRLVL